MKWSEREHRFLADRTLEPAIERRSATRARLGIVFYDTPAILTRNRSDWCDRNAHSGAGPTGFAAWWVEGRAGTGRAAGANAIVEPPDDDARCSMLSYWIANEPGLQHFDRQYGVLC